MATEYTHPIDLTTEPPTVSVDGEHVVMSQNIAQFDNTGLWGAEQLSFDWPSNPGASSIEENFDTIWVERMNQAIAESTPAPEENVTDALLTDMYEQMLSMQEAQAATDAALCDLYEALGGEQ